MIREVPPQRSNISKAAAIKRTKLAAPRKKKFGEMPREALLYSAVRQQRITERREVWKIPMMLKAPPNYIQGVAFFFFKGKIKEESDSLGLGCTRNRNL